MKTSSKEVAIYRRSRESFGFFCREILGCVPWDMQVEIAQSVKANRTTVVKSCHSSGKDWCSGRIVPWVLHTERPSKVITTAPTDRQVRLILWSEIAAAYQRSRFPLGGRLLSQECHVAPGHFAVGFATRDYNPDAFQGFHSDYLLVVLDEADGITPAIRSAILSLTSSGDSHVLEIGNPVNPLSEFAKRFSEPGVNKITIDAFSTPNFTHFGLKQSDFGPDMTWEQKVNGEKNPFPFLCTPEWVAEVLRKHRYDWNAPYVRSRVLAQFPHDSPDQLFPLHTIEMAHSMEYTPREGDVKILVCDVARFGDDMTVIGFRHGKRYRKIAEWNGKDLMQTTNRLISFMLDLRPHEIRVDDDGLGGGVVDSLREKLRSMPGAPVIVPMRGGSSAKNEEQYPNCRSEWHHELQEHFLSGDVDLDPADEDLVQQLTSIKVDRFDKKGRRLVMAKDDLKKALGRSPDDADVLVYAFAAVQTAPKLDLL